MESDLSTQPPQDVQAPQNPVNPESVLLQEIAKPLYEMGGWLKFIGIVGIVMIALVLVAFIPGILLMSSVGRGGFQSEGLIIGVITMAVMLIPLAFTIWMYSLLIKAGKLAGPAYKNADRKAFVGSLKSLKTYFIVTGVLTIISLVGLSLYICILVFLIPTMMRNITF